MKIPPVKGGIRKLGVLRPSDSIFKAVLIPQRQYSQKNLDSLIHHKEHEATRRLIKNLLISFLCVLRELRGKN